MRENTKFVYTYIHMYIVHIDIYIYIFNKYINFSMGGSFGAEGHDRRKAKIFPRNPDTESNTITLDFFFFEKSS